MGYSTKYKYYFTRIYYYFNFSANTMAKWLIYELIAKTTGLLMHMTSNVIIMVLSLTFNMCILAGFISAQKTAKY